MKANAVMKISRNLCAWITILLFSLNIIRFKEFSGCQVHGSRLATLRFSYQFSSPPAVGGQGSLTLNREPWNPISCELALLSLDFFVSL